jgi:uncharacterized protein (TIGR00255 family)
MTGYGEARYQGDRLTLSIELRAVNNRHLKITVRAPDPYHLLEPQFEKVIRKSVQRGTVQVFVRCERPSRPGDFRIDPVALRSYLQQVREVCAALGDPSLAPALLGQVLALPGVAAQPADVSAPPDEDWPIFEKVLEAALSRFNAMRREEGAAMARELLSLHGVIATHLELIRGLIPGVVPAYRDRLLERVRGLLSETGVAVDENALIKEVAIFAERSDVAEEVVRLESHLEQFRRIIETESDGPGRKLEFVVQEMGRETNTIGSKAGDVQISRQVFEIKAAIEKIREMIQNVE